MRADSARYALCLILFLGLPTLACTLGTIASQSPETAPVVNLPPTTASDLPAPLTPPSDPGAVIQPDDLTYLGAFRLPDDGLRPRTFEYGGNAMTFRPGPDLANDGFPGSLFISGHDRMPYGELTDGGQLAEVSIPAPALSSNVADLPQAEFLQNFHDVLAGRFREIDDIPRIGLLYLDTPPSGPRLHVTWGQHIEPDPTLPTHAWLAPDLSNPDFQGEWFIAGQSWYSVNDYMFEIPVDWGSTYLDGRIIATGRFKDGGWSGMGPALIAYRPWDTNGNPPNAGASIQATPLLRYADSTETDAIERCLSGYQHPDEWSGGAWLMMPSGKSAVLFAGAKSLGIKYWYGYVNPAGPELSCVDGDVTDFVTCRMADGSPCPPQDFKECAGHNGIRGWWTTRWETQFIFYDPADLARVASGEIAPWQPQPYAIMNIDERMFFNPSGVELDMLGSGSQRRYRLGDVAYDRTNGLLYVLELFADGAKPVVHVWRVE